MKEWKNEWLNERMNDWMIELMNDWIHAWMTELDDWTNAIMNAWIMNEIQRKLFKKEIQMRKSKNGGKLFVFCMEKLYLSGYNDRSFWSYPNQIIFNYIFFFPKICFI